jgi:outer membrane receptor protein involved in Fe transport
MAVSSNNHTVVESRGLYLQDQIRLNDQWQILAGVRFDQFEVETTNKLRNLSENRTTTASARAWAWSTRHGATTPSMPPGARPTRPSAAA